MRGNSRAPKSGKAKPQLEWQMDDSEAEWQKSQHDEPTSEEAYRADLPVMQWFSTYWQIVTLLLLLLAACSVWLWQVAQRGVVQIETELREQIEVELWTTETKDAQLPLDFSNVRVEDPVHPTMRSIELLVLSKQVAIVRLVTKPTQGLPALRQIRFYRQTQDGWQRIKPEATLWGSPQRLETSFFIFEYRQQDVAAVALAAPQIDAMYSEIAGNFGVTPRAGKQVIEVSVEAMTGAIPFPYSTREPIVVPSPAAYVAPNDLSDNTILAQSIALPLLEMIGEQAVAEYRISTRWSRLLRGLRLWQLWQLDMPLAQWQQEVVRWLYIDTPNLDGELHPVLPERYAELCAMHRLWMLAPRVVGLPLECTSSDAVAWSSRQWSNLKQPLQLDSLGVPQIDMWNPAYRESNLTQYSSEDVAIALLFDYIANTYGNQYLPMLLSGLSQYKDWETLVPAVFGLAASDFEVRWQRYLVRQYDLPLDN